MSKKLKGYDKFINDVTEIYKGKYNYSKFIWNGWHEEGIIICPEHGEFNKTPANHKRQGCPVCKEAETKIARDIKNKDAFFSNAKQKYNNKYDYSISVYKGTHSPIDIICPIHGKFTLTPNEHLNGNACHKCAMEEMKKNLLIKNSKEFFRQAKIIHNNKYDYSISVYKGGDKPIDIICPEHGKFTIKRAGKHTSKEREQGCPKCKKGSMSIPETRICEYLSSWGYKYEYNYKFKDNEYLSNKPFDFYLTDLNIIIEYDGKQHFIVNSYSKTEEALENRQFIDREKERILKEAYNINVYRIRYDQPLMKTLKSILSSTTIETVNKGVEYVSEETEIVSTRNSEDIV